MGICMHWISLEQAFDDLKHTSVAIWCDNISAVSWICKFWTSTSPVASSILQALATQIYVCQSGLLAIDHISGLFNVMTYVALQKHSTGPQVFLSIFSTTFPPPQKTSWTLFLFSNKLASKLFSAICPKHSGTVSWGWLNVKGCVFGQLGKHGLLLTSPLFTQTPNLQQIRRPFQIELLAAFVHHMQSGGVSTRTHQIRAQMVQVALWTISTKIQLDRQQNPVVDAQRKISKAD